MRRIRAREAREWPAPRRGSIDEAVSQMASSAASARRRVRELLAQAEIRLVMTAHPTEARRRTTIDKLARIFRELRALDERLGRDAERRTSGFARPSRSCGAPTSCGRSRRRCSRRCAAASCISPARWSTSIPRVYRELDRALRDAYPEAQIEVPPLLRFGSWIGGDRDGNPFVTPETTEQTLALLRDQCLRVPRGPARDCSPGGSPSRSGSPARGRGSTRSWRSARSASRRWRSGSRSSTRRSPTAGR